MRATAPNLNHASPAGATAVLKLYTGRVFRRNRYSTAQATPSPGSSSPGPRRSRLHQTMARP